jgi:hypothetical protein
MTRSQFDEMAANDPRGAAEVLFEKTVEQDAKIDALEHTVAELVEARVADAVQ